MNHKKDCCEKCKCTMESCIKNSTYAMNPCHNHICPCHSKAPEKECEHEYLQGDICQDCFKRVNSPQPNQEWEKAIRDVGKVSGIHPEIIDEFVLITKEAIKANSQDLLERVLPKEKDNNLTKPDSEADYKYQGFNSALKEIKHNWEELRNKI